MHRLYILLSLLLAAGIPAGCQVAAAPIDTAPSSEAPLDPGELRLAPVTAPKPPASAAKGRVTAADPRVCRADGLVARFRVIPRAPVPMQASVLELTLRDSSGKPATRRKVSFDLTMPAMAMPPNRPKAREQSPGVYRAEAIFTMAGAWEAHAQVNGAGKATRFTFRLSTK